MTSTRCLIELHYLPCIAWFTAVNSYSEIILEKHEHYIKQSYRNRCHILGANRPEKLIVPITSKHNHTLVTDLRIDYSQKWLNNHWRALESSYRKAPYFEHYADELHKVLFTKWRFLYDLNYNLLFSLLHLLGKEIRVSETILYEKNPSSDEVDLRNRINPKKPANEKNFRWATYTQVFGNSFVSNLSIIDLLFCKGPAARTVIESSAMAQ
jgi:hypothetical protein